VPEKNRFRVKLEGRDPDWKDVGNERKAFYNDLPPRRYRFRVLASNNSGVWNEAGDSFDFSIDRRTIKPVGSAVKASPLHTRWTAGVAGAGKARSNWLRVSVAVCQAAPLFYKGGCQEKKLLLRVGPGEAWA
jgi:hypothetical protein